MVYRYVPILRFKQGERKALEKLSPKTKLGVMPLMVLAPAQYVGKKATKSEAAIPSPQHFVRQMSLAWGGFSYYLDASTLPATAVGHPLTDIAAEARAVGHLLIPCTNLGVSQQYQAAVASTAAVDGRGAALRIDLSELAQSASWVPNWKLPTNLTDLIIDLEEVNLAVDLGTALDPAFSSLVSVWRSVTLVGTNIPSNFQGAQAGLILRNRAELDLWKRLNTINLKYRLDFGDYATVGSAPPPQGIKWGYPITVKYTLGASFLICRGVRTTGANCLDMDVQLHGHAQKIVAYVGRAPLAHCWADGEIDAIANATKSPGGLTQWVGYSINRHIENTRTVIP
jgi:hypothetical protein